MSKNSYLDELKRRLIYSVCIVALIAIPLCIFARHLYTFLALPLLTHLPVGSQLIATSITSPFLTPFKFALIVAVFISMPFLLWQLWVFISPALYQQERRFFWPLLLLSIFLFYAGVAFAYVVIFPLVFQFFIGVTPAKVTLMPDISYYLDFALTLFFAFGLAFEAPVVTVLLVKSGLADIETLKKKRPHVIVGAFVMGMLLTPPDIISQTLLAIPMWLLFETGIILAGVLNLSPITKQQPEQ